MNTFLSGLINGLADNHAHLNMLDQPLEVIESFYKNNGRYVLDVAVNKRALNKSLQFLSKLSEDFKRIVKLSFGIHPEYFKPIEFLRAEESNFAYADPEQAVQDTIQIFKEYKQIKVLGEIGLDIYKLQDNQSNILAKQEAYLGQIVEFAKQNNVPVMLHLRGVDNSDFSLFKRALSILEQAGIKSCDDLPVYFHSFTADLDVAKFLTDRGFFIGINGIITYSNVEHIREAVKYTPSQFILVETDSPFLKPSNLGQSRFKQNTPLSVQKIQEYIDKLKSS